MRQRVQQRMERLGGTQFNIDISNVRQKTRKQFASTGGRQCVRPALGRMTRGGDQRRWQTSDAVFDLVLNRMKMVESQLKQIRWLRHVERDRQIVHGGDDSHNLSTR